MCRRKSKQAQDALLQKVNEDTLRSLTQSKEAGPSGDPGRKVSEVISYRSHADVPVVRDYVIQVDPPLSPLWPWQGSCFRGPCASLSCGIT